eukprot:CAMPEP_0198654540 /NCGR_PEP_ID=MMETSP1467-20131203/7783_1 /TAXON_ID=1462469 /ORGANISM="unid. sp., Strain CCMP2135" /LENGTH=335 /DNA_ID=CAMNT_0044390527 /DNA_START=42 /DNA_END=1049 /DNA_ORIENTATION=+
MMQLVVTLLATVVAGLGVTEKVLVVGASGGTGPRAIRGLLDGETIAASQVHVLSRNPDSATCQVLRKRGLAVHRADLEDATSVRAAIAAIEPTFAYVHGTGDDSKQLDGGEVKRARVLAAALAACRSLKLVCYNSAGAAPEDVDKVARIRQKRECERVYRNALAASKVCSLRANLFMEELWKKYTRPTILKKKRFEFSVGPNRVIYLTSVRDVGRLAARAFSADEDDVPKAIDVASDAKTPTQMAAAFGVPYRRNRLLPLVARLLAPELFQILRFYQTSSHHPKSIPFADVSLTSFEAFLAESHWSDPSRSYDTLVNDLLPDHDHDHHHDGGAHG